VGFFFLALYLFGRGSLLAGLGGGARVIRAPSGRPLLGMFLGRIFGLGIFRGQMGAGSGNAALEFWGPGRQIRSAMVQNMIEIAPVSD